jgi:hypothetical protein
MKKVIVIVIVIVLMSGLTLQAQAPEGFSYHAIVRDYSGVPIVTQPVSFRFSILKGSPLSSEVYSEIHNILTDQFGEVSLVIGNGIDKSGSLLSIDWGADSYFIKAELDITGGTSYTDMGTTQLLSVPYALYAKTSQL